MHGNFRDEDEIYCKAQTFNPLNFQMICRANKNSANYFQISPIEQHLILILAIFETAINILEMRPLPIKCHKIGFLVPMIDDLPVSIFNLWGLTLKKGQFWDAL
jgi:hypothetical protein